MLDLLQEILLYIEQQHDWLVKTQFVNDEKQHKYNILHLNITCKIIEELTKQVSSEFVVDKIDVTREQLDGDTAATCDLISDNETLDDNFEHDAIDKGNSSQEIGQEASALKQYKKPHELDSISQEHVIQNKKSSTSNINEDLLDEINSNLDYEKDESADNDGDSNLFPVLHQVYIKQEQSRCKAKATCGMSQVGTDDLNKDFELDAIHKGNLLQVVDHATLTHRQYNTIEELDSISQEHLIRNNEGLKLNINEDLSDEMNSISDDEKSIADDSDCDPNSFVCSRITFPILHQFQMNKLYLCIFCGKSCKKRAQLIIHERIHTGEKPFKCSICNKSFRAMVLLYKHKRIHTDEKPYKCSICYKSFSLNGKLKNHMMIHTGEKPYNCSYCKKSFRKNHTLARHNILAHTGERCFKRKLN